MTDFPLFTLDDECRFRLAYDRRQWIIQRRRGKDWDGIWFIGDTKANLEHGLHRFEIELTCDEARDKGGIVASARLTKDHQDMMEADGWLDTSEADAVRDNERLRGRLYREACGVAIGRILDSLL